MTTVQFNVTNDTGSGALDGMAIFVYTLPLASQYELFSLTPYRTLRPGNGSTSFFTWSGLVAGQTLSPDGTISAIVAIPVGQLSQATSEGGLTPTLGPPAPSTLVDVSASGIQNATSPYESFNAVWSVDTQNVAKSVVSLTASTVSQFGLDKALYWGVSESACSSATQITTCTPYTIPPGVTEVVVSVTYSYDTSVFTFMFSPS
jgi:hypothetical protein